jgi:hypothetical protein
MAILRSFSITVRSVGLKRAGHYSQADETTKPRARRGFGWKGWWEIVILQPRIF